MKKAITSLTCSLFLLLATLTSAQNTQTFTYQGFVFQNYTIPTSGYYLLTAKGGQGGSCNGYSGGKGASMSCYTFLNAGTQLRITVAGAGESVSGYENGAGGGGSSAVVIANGGNSYSPVLIAGGGGGAGNGLGGDGGQIITNATSGKYDDGSPASSGGISGGGGATNTSSDGGGGAGFYTDGGTSTSGSNVNAWGGQAYLSGNYGGGGGGYSGGGAGGTNRDNVDAAYPLGKSGAGGGGGSFIASNANTNGLVQLPGDNSGDGLVTITGPNTTTDVVNSPFNPYTWPANGSSYTAAGTYYYVDSANAVTRILDLSFGLQSCSSYTRVDTTVVSCGGYTSALNGRTYTENSTDSIRIGCTKYVARIIVAPPSTALATPPNLGSLACIFSPLLWSSRPHDHATMDFVACRNTVDTFTVAEVPYATSYQWSLPSGASGSSTTNRIVVSFSNQFSGGPISVTPVNSCGNGDTLGMNIALPAHVPAGHLQISGPSAPHISGSYSVAPIAGATTYTWSVSNNQAVIVSGQGTPYIHLLAQPGFKRANLSVVASNCKGDGSRGNLPLNANGGNLGFIVARSAFSQPADISIYPNPSNGQFTISTLSLQTDATLEVYSADGRLVYQQTIPSTTTETSIDLQDPAAGLYQVRIIAGGEVRMTKVVVN